MDFFTTIINLEFIAVLSFLLCCSWMAISPCLLCCGCLKVDYENYEENKNNKNEKEDEDEEDEIHNKISSYTEKMVILNWYDRNQISYIVRHPITDVVWQKLLSNQDKMASACNELVEGWALSIIQDNLFDKYSQDKKERLHNEENKGVNEGENKGVNEENDEEKLKGVFSTFSNNMLRMYAGISDNNKQTKEELVECVMEILRSNQKKVIQKRLEKLEKMLE